MKRLSQILFSSLCLLSMDGKAASNLDGHELRLLVLHLGVAHPFAGRLLQAQALDPSALARL